MIVGWYEVCVWGHLKSEVWGRQIQVNFLILYQRGEHYILGTAFFTAEMFISISL